MEDDEAPRNFIDDDYCPASYVTIVTVFRTMATIVTPIIGESWKFVCDGC